MSTANSLRAAVRLVHPFPVAIVVTSSLLLLIIAHGGFPPLSSLLRAGATVLLSQIGVGALNDYLDHERDALTQPQKPIPSGLIAPGIALALALGSLFLFVPVALTFGPAAFAVSALGTAAGISYDLWLKPTVLSFLPYVAGFLLLFTWTWLITGHLRPALFLTYPPGALLIVAAHLAQSFPDIEADLATGQRGLAVVLGPRRTLYTIVAFYGLTAVPGGIATLLVGPAVAQVLVAASLVLALASLRPARRALRQRPARTAFFHLIAPAIALLALGSVMAAAAIL